MTRIWCAFVDEDIGNVVHAVPRVSTNAPTGARAGSECLATDDDCKRRVEDAIRFLHRMRPLDHTASSGTLKA